jgi:hypothetical protein
VMMSVFHDPVCGMSPLVGNAEPERPAPSGFDDGFKLVRLSC